MKTMRDALAEYKASDSFTTADTDGAFLNGWLMAMQAISQEQLESAGIKFDANGFAVIDSHRETLRQDYPLDFSKYSKEPL